MRIIHCADLHLGSKMRTKLPAEKAEERRGELRETFDAMLRYARKAGAAAILIAGDAFDVDRPSLLDKQFFYNAVRANGDLTFFYLRGNHDAAESGALEEDLPNLKTFDKEWKTYSFRGVNVSGAEFSSENAETLYRTLRLPQDGVNVVLLHGDVGGEIDLKRLRDRGIDYLALGHIHAFSSGEIDRRGVYAYSGCLEGRGFDECGKKGFILLDIPDANGNGSENYADAYGNVGRSRQKISFEFIPFARREIAEYRVDVSAARDCYEAREIVRAAVVSPPKDLVRVYLTGEVSFDRRALRRSTEETLLQKYYFVSVKDEMREKADYARYASEENSLLGEYARLLYSREDLTAEEKNEAFRLAFSALQNGEADL